MIVLVIAEVDVHRLIRHEGRAGVAVFVGRRRGGRARVRDEIDRGGRCRGDGEIVVTRRQRVPEHVRGRSRVTGDLVVGVGVSMRIMTAFSGSFQAQLQPFLATI